MYFLAAAHFMDSSKFPRYGTNYIHNAIWLVSSYLQWKFYSKHPIRQLIAKQIYSYSIYFINWDSVKHHVDFWRNFDQANIKLDFRIPFSCESDSMAFKFCSEWDVPWKQHTQKYDTQNTHKHTTDLIRNWHEIISFISFSL